MDQLSFFETAVAAMTIGVVHVPGEGWRLTVSARKPGQDWHDGYVCRYSCLNRAELAQLIDDEVASHLRLS